MVEVRQEAGMTAHGVASSGRGRDVAEPPVARIAVQAVGTGPGDVEIEMPVVVVIGEQGCGLPSPGAHPGFA